MSGRHAFDAGDSLFETRAVAGRTGPKILLGIVVVLGLLGAWLTLRGTLRWGGRGAPDSTLRVLAVGNIDETVPRWVSDESGLSVTSIRAAEAVDRGRALGAGGSDVQAILEFADEEGFGWVAFELARGPAWDLSALGEAPPPPGATFAVIGAGDVASSSRLSFGGPITEVEFKHPVDQKIGLLLALAEQPTIAEALESRGADTELVIAVNHKGMKTEVASVRELGAQMATKARWSLPEVAAADPTSAAPTVMPLHAAPWTEVEAFGAHDGGILLEVRSSRWVSEDGRTASRIAAAETTIGWIPHASLVGSQSAGLDGPGLAASALACEHPEGFHAISVTYEGSLVTSWSARRGQRVGGDLELSAERCSIAAIRRIRTTETPGSHTQGMTTGAYAGGVELTDTTRSLQLGLHPWYRPRRAPGVDVFALASDVIALVATRAFQSDGALDLDGEAVLLLVMASTEDSSAPVLFEIDARTLWPEAMDPTLLALAGPGPDDVSLSAIVEDANGHARHVRVAPVGGDWRGGLRAAGASAPVDRDDLRQVLLEGAAEVASVVVDEVDARRRTMIDAVVAAHARGRALGPALSIRSRAVTPPGPETIAIASPGGRAIAWMDTSEHNPGTTVWITDLATMADPTPRPVLTEVAPSLVRWTRDGGAALIHGRYERGSVQSPVTFVATLPSPETESSAVTAPP